MIALVQDESIFTPAVYEPHPGIGASKVGVILGASPYCTPAELRDELIGLRPEFTGNLDSDIGNALEPVIARHGARRYGWILGREKSKQHPEFPWAWASPDYLILGENPGVLEVKNKRFNAKPGGPHDLRPCFRFQVRWQLACRDMERGFALIHYMAEGNEEKRFECLEVKRDREIEEGMIAVVGLFHANVEECRALLAAGAKPEDLPPLPECFNRKAA